MVFLGLSRDNAKFGAFQAEKALLPVVFKSETWVMGEPRPHWTRRASCPDPHPQPSSLRGISLLAALRRLFFPHLIYFFSSPSLLPSPAPPRAEIATKRALPTEIPRQEENRLLSVSHRETLEPSMTRGHGGEWGKFPFCHCLFSMKTSMP